MYKEEVYRFSHSVPAFYPHSMKDDYERAGTWPEDGVDVYYNTFEEFGLTQAPFGMTLGVGGDGYPCWVMLPPPTKEEILAATEGQRKALIAEVDAISPVKWASIEPEEQESWVAYRKALVGLPKQPGYPDGVAWPQKPEISE